MDQGSTLEQIAPFVRNIQFITIDGQTDSPVQIPYDCRLFFTQNGCGRMRVDHRELLMEKGSVLIFNAAIPYQFLKPAHSATFIEISFDYVFRDDTPMQPIPPATADNFVPENAILPIDVVCATQFLSHPVFIKNAISIENRLLEIYREFTESTWYYHGVTSNLFHSILFTIARGIAFEAYGESADKTEVIIQFIKEHYREPLTNQDIANSFWFTPNHLNKLLVSRTGMSLHRFLVNYRISKAIELLQTTSLSVSDVSSAVGFNDLCHFSRCFKKATGKSPREFKAKSSMGKQAP